MTLIGTLLTSAFFGGFLLVVGAALGVGVSLWVASHLVRWLERKGLLP
jgi:hypothetical protein